MNEHDSPAASLTTERASPFESARRKAYWRLLPILFVSYMVAYVDRQNVAVAALTMSLDMPLFDSKVIGFGSGIFFLGYLLLEIPGTLLVERWSARKWITRIMVTWGIMAALTAAVRTPGQFYAVRFCLGLAEAGFFPGVIVYLTHWFTKRDRARALAFFFVASPLAQIVSPFVNRWLLPIGVDEAGLVKLHMDGYTPVPHVMGLTGWQWIYILWGVPAVVMAVVVYFLLTDRPGQAAWLTAEERSALEAALTKEKADGGNHRPHLTMDGLRHPRVWMLAAGMVCAVTATYSVEFFMPRIIMDWHGLDIQKLTGLIMLPPLLALILQPLTAWSSDRLQERRWHATVPIIVSGTCMACLPFAQHNLVMTIVLFMLILAGCKAYMPAFWSLPSLFLVNTAAAGSIGLINSLGNTGGFFGPTLFGWLKGLTGSYDAGIYCLSGFLFVSAILIFRIATKCEEAQPARGE